MKIEILTGIRFSEPVIIRVFKVFFWLWRQANFKLLFGFILSLFFSLSIIIHIHCMEEFRSVIYKNATVFPDSLER